jgi:ketosteroid isomerase-like protein
MIKIRIAIAAIVGTALIGFGCARVADEQPASDAESTAKMSAEEGMDDLAYRWDQAMASGDGGKVLALYTENPAVMPPDGPSHSGPEAAGAFFGEMLADGPRTVSNRVDRVLASGDLVIGRGSYTLAVSDESGASRDQIGKWSCVARQSDDGSLVAVRNIWNRDMPPPGAPPLPTIEATSPGPAEDAACLASPKAADDAFVRDFVEGNGPALVAMHSEQAARMAPGLPIVDGREAVGAYLQSRIDLFSERDLELSEIGEEIEGDLGYSWGRFRYAYRPRAGGEPFEGAGKYLAVSQKDAAGCWRNEWVIWNFDSPWPEGS